MRLDLSAVFNKAIRLIREDIRNGVVDGKQFGATFEPNADSTARQKGFNKPLVGKGKRFIKVQSYKVDKATSSKQEASLTFKTDKDADIALYNHAGTSRGIPARPFWGISEKASKKVMEETDLYINKTVDNEFERMGFKKR